MDLCSLAVLSDYKTRAQLSYQPRKPRMLRYLDRCPRRIVCLRHGHRSRVPCDMDYLAAREPSEQFPHVSDIDRKLDTSPLAAAEACNLLYENSGDGTEASVRLLDSAGNLSFQFRIISRINVFKSPESAVQTGQVSPGETQVDHLLHLFIHTQIAYAGS